MNSRNLEIGKRTFSTGKIPVASKLGRKLISSKDSAKIITAVRMVVKTGKSAEQIKLSEAIK